MSAKALARVVLLLIYGTLLEGYVYNKSSLGLAAKYGILNENNREECCGNLYFRHDDMVCTLLPIHKMGELYA